MKHSKSSGLGVKKKASDLLDQKIGKHSKSLDLDVEKKASDLLDQKIGKYLKMENVPPLKVILKTEIDILSRQIAPLIVQIDKLDRVLTDKLQEAYDIYHSGTSTEEQKRRAIKAVGNVKQKLSQLDREYNILQQSTFTMLTYLKRLLRKKGKVKKSFGENLNKKKALFLEGSDLFTFKEPLTAMQIFLNKLKEHKLPYKSKDSKSVVKRLLRLAFKLDSGEFFGDSSSSKNSDEVIKTDFSIPKDVRLDRSSQKLVNELEVKKPKKSYRLKKRFSQYKSKGLELDAEKDKIFDKKVDSISEVTYSSRESSCPFFQLGNDGTVKVNITKKKHLFVYNEVYKFFDSLKFKSFKFRANKSSVESLMSQAEIYDQARKLLSAFQLEEQAKNSEQLTLSVEEEKSAMDVIAQARVLDQAKNLLGVLHRSNKSVDSKRVSPLKNSTTVGANSSTLESNNARVLKIQ